MLEYSPERSASALRSRTAFLSKSCLTLYLLFFGWPVLNDCSLASFMLWPYTTPPVGRWSSSVWIMLLATLLSAARLSTKFLLVPFLGRLRSSVPCPSLQLFYLCLPGDRPGTFLLGETILFPDLVLRGNSVCRVAAAGLAGAGRAYRS